MIKPPAIVLSIALLAASVFSVYGAEERIRGVLERTARAAACAQITDVLDDVYYIAKSDAAEKMIAPFVGRNVVVVITGTVSARANGQEALFDLKTVSKFVPPAKPAATNVPADGVQPR